MKIGILTQPTIATNYGCIMQAYALQYYLRLLGFKADTIKLDNTVSESRLIYYTLKCFIKKIIKPFNYNIHLPMLSFDKYKVISKNTHDFIDKHLKYSKKTYHSNDLIGCDELKEYDAFIVGSDQVWRTNKSLNNYVRNCLLEFAKSRKGIKRISYAASFGVDTFDCCDKELSLCKELISKFNAISVREDSGVDICHNKFNVEAIKVLDPTMLLDAQHYLELSKERDDFKNDGDLLTYILDESNIKKLIIKKVADILHLKQFSVLQKPQYYEFAWLFNRKPLLSAEQWLRSFYDAKYVVTDSFHGTVFSILFKRPFIAIGNSFRGMTRFTSLLKLFGLEERLVLKPEDVTEELIKKPIDYDRVYKILEIEREKSKKFLLNALNIKK